MRAWIFSSILSFVSVVNGQIVNPNATICTENQYLDTISLSCIDCPDSMISRFDKKGRGLANN